MDTTTNETNQQQSPVVKLTLGQVHVTVWENNAQDGRVYFTTRVERRYTDQNNQWQTSTSFGKSSLPVLIDLLTKALARVEDLEKQMPSRTAA